LEDQGVGGKMGSEWILGKLPWGVWIGFDWLRTGTGGGDVVSAVMNLRVLAPRS
jgi:Ni/Fe-hydrogenase subunit HybB-like protein